MVFVAFLKARTMVVRSEMMWAPSIASTSFFSAVIGAALLFAFQGYYHELFLKGRPGLSVNMKRMKVKGTAKLKRDPETEPK